jgi:hypothetical protein
MVNIDLRVVSTSQLLYTLRQQNGCAYTYKTLPGKAHNFDFYFKNFTSL